MGLQPIFNQNATQYTATETKDLKQIDLRKDKANEQLLLDPEFQIN